MTGLPEDYWVFMLTSVVIPTVLAFVLLVLRWRISKWLQSPTDFLAVVAVIDLAVLFFPESYTFLAYSSSADLVITIGACTIVAAAYVVWDVEPLLTDVEEIDGRISDAPWLALMTAWGLAIGVFFWHMLAFSGG